MKKFLKFISLPLVSLTPAIALAQNAAGATGILTRISNLLGAILPLLVSLGVIYFVWGVVQYFIGDSEEAKEKGRDRIIYGIIGLVVIVSLWGLVAIVADTFGIGGESAPPVNNLVVAPVDSTSCKAKIEGNPTFANFLDYATCIIGNSVIPFIFALAVLMFLWGAVNFLILHADDEEKRAQGRMFMIWGIIALVVMISVWGLVKIVGSTFGVETNFLPQVQPYK